jgi:hypothetical protein
LSAWQPSQGAALTSAVRLQWDGTNWRQVSGGAAMDQNGRVYFPQDILQAPGNRIDAAVAGGLFIGTLTATGLTLARAGVDVTVGGNIRHSKQSPAFNAAPNPDATQGEIFAMAALTGAVNVGNPANAAQGQRIRFYWTQDGTGGRVVTYSGANFRSVGIAAQVTTASTVTIDEAECIDGTIWRVTRLVTGQTV